MIDRITFNKSVSVAFAVVPLLSAVFCFAQLMHLSNVPYTSIFNCISVLFIDFTLLIVFSKKWSLSSEPL